MRCSVLGCKSDSERKNTGLSFHSFPSKLKLREKWIRATGRKEWEPKKYSKICSQHFETVFLMKKETNTYLGSDAVPTKFIKCDYNTKNYPMKSYSSMETDYNNGIHIFDAVVSVEKFNPMKLDDHIEVPSTSEIKLQQSGFANVNIANKNYTNISSSPINTPDFSPRILRLKWKKACKKSEDRLKKLRALREKCRRLIKKVATLEKLPKDVNNYVHNKTMGSVKKISVKPVALSSKFDCQRGEVGVPSSISQMDTATEGHIKTEPMDDSEDMSMYCDKDAQTLQHKTHIIDEETYSKTLKCCVCGGDIVGFRYTCVECIEFSLCGACEANARHGQHYVLRVPESKPMAEVQSVLATIRQHLFKDMDIVPDVESTLSIKSEMDVKQEDITIEEHVLDDMPRNTSLPTAYMDDHNYSAKEDAVSSGDIKADMGTTGAKEMAIHTRNEREGDSEHPTILPDDGSTYDVPTLPAPSTAKRKLSTQDNTNVNNGTNNKENRLTMVCVPAQSRPMIEINAGNIVIPTQSNAKPVILVQLLRTPKEASVNPPDT